MAEVEEALANATRFAGPVVVHVLTQKGRGYEPAERDPIKHMHDTSGVKPGSYTEAFTESLVKAAESRPELVAITEAIAIGIRDGRVGTEKTLLLVGETIVIEVSPG